jgi:hypothetical protein
MHSAPPLRNPLLRLLAVNLAIGIAAAVLMLGGLFALNPHGLRDLILADNSGAAAAGLLFFGLVITFGSVAMGTAIMALGSNASRSGGGNTRRRSWCPLPLRERATAAVQ